MSQTSRKPLFSFDSGAWWGLGLFVFAFGFRLLGIGWGLPNDRHLPSLHPDEPIVYLYSQQIKPGQFNFDPGFYNYGTLYLTVLRVASDMLSSYGGGPASKSEEDTWKFIGRVDLAGRIINSLAGAGTALLVFACLRRRTIFWGALAGGVAMAVAPGNVIHSRFQTVDVFGAFLFMASVACALKLTPGRDEAEQPEPKWLKWGLWAGIFAGLSAGTKYSGVLAILALFVAVFYIPKGRRLACAGVGILATAVGFFAATPGALTNTQKFIEDFQFEVLHTSTGHGLVFAGTSPGFIYHMANLSAGFGIILTILGAGGLLAAAIRKHPWAFVVLAAAVPTYILIGRAEVKFFRYVLPLIPLLAMGFGWLVGQAQISPQRWWRVAVVAGLFGIGASLSQALIASAYMMARDPRDEAADYLKKNSKPGDTVALVSDPWFQTPTLYPLTPVPRSVPFPMRDGFMKAASNPAVMRYVPDNPEERKDWDQRVLDSKPTWVVYSSYEFDDLFRLSRLNPSDPEFAGQIADFQAFMSRLEKEYQRDNLFGVGGPTIHDLMYIRPIIYIWKRKPDSRMP